VVTKKCTRVADRAFPEIGVTWRQPGDFSRSSFERPFVFKKGSELLAFDDRNIEWLLIVSLLGIGTAFATPIVSRSTNCTNFVSALISFGGTAFIMLIVGGLILIRNRLDK